MDRVLAILKELKPEISFTSTMSLLDDGILDSLEVIELVDRISAEFGIVIEPDDIDPDNFETAEKIWELIEKRGGKAI